jgi:hypothetical protein
MENFEGPRYKALSPVIIPAKRRCIPLKRPFVQGGRIGHHGNGPLFYK